MAKKPVTKKARPPVGKRVVRRKLAMKRRAVGGKQSRTKQAAASSSNNSPPPPKRTFSVTIIDPVSDSEVGRSFTVCGSSDAAPGLQVLVKVWEGTVLRYQQTGTIDDEHGWQVEFTDVAQASNYRITAELAAGGSNVDEVTDIDVAKFSIDDPSSDSTVGTDCSVTGHCHDIIAAPALTVNVIFTPLTGAPVLESATTSPDGYFIAHFPSLTTGSGGKLQAVDGNSATSNEVTGLEVEGSTATTVITEPTNGQLYTEIDDPARVGRTVIHRARGTHKKNRTVFAYVTQKGKCFKPPIKVLDKGPSGLTKRNWEIELYKLFRGKAPAGTYHFHLVAVNPSGNFHMNHHHRSSGRIVVLT